MDPIKLAPYVNRFKELLANRLRRKKDHLADYYNTGEGTMGMPNYVPETYIRPMTHLNPNDKPASILDLYVPPGDFTGLPPSPWARKVSSSPWAVDQEHQRGVSSP